MIKIFKEIKDYIKFSSIKNKGVVFYSESSIYYKYFEKLIDDVLSISNDDIYYVTSDYNDSIFSKNNSRIKVFYINSLLKTFLQYLDCKVFVTTMTELGNHNYVKSIANKDIEYIYVFHAVVSTNMMYMEGAFDNFDTIFSVGSHHNREIRERENIYNLKEKNILNYGYPLLEKLSIEYDKYNIERDKKNVLIAPSWHKDNILDLCIDDLLSNIDDNKYNLTIRPHPEYLKRYNDKFKELEKKYKDKKIIFDRQMISNQSLLSADLLITDWSGIAFEYSFASIRPVLFINTPKKVHNENWQKYENQPMEIVLRDGCGISLNIDELSKISSVIDEFFNNYGKYKEHIVKLREEYIYNFGKVDTTCPEYIVSKVRRK